MNIIIERINTYSLVNAIQYHSKVVPGPVDSHTVMRKETHLFYKLHDFTVGTKTKAQNCLMQPQSSVKILYRISVSMCHSD